MGRIQHHELNTSDLDGAKRFYGAVFGWTFDDMPMPTGVYSMVKTAGGDGFGGFQKHPMPGAPSAWLDYVSVGSLADTLAKVTANGGTIAVPAMDIPGMGSFAVCQDPQGAHFAIWQAAAGSPTPPAGSGSPLGLIQHHELNTSDVDGAKRFYAAVFGWTYDDVPMPTGVYSIVKTAEGEGLGGLWAHPVPGAPSAWLNYVNVASLAEALAKVTAHGGKILMPATEVPGMGSFAVCEDPQGAAIAMWQAAAAAAAPPPPPPKPKSAPPPPKPKSAPPAPAPKPVEPAKPAKKEPAKKAAAPKPPAEKPAKAAKKPAKKAAKKPAKAAKKPAKKAAKKPAKAAEKPAKKAAKKPAKAAKKPAKKAAKKPTKKAAKKPAKAAKKPAKAAKKPAKKAAKKPAKAAKKPAKKAAKKAKKKGKK